MRYDSVGYIKDFYYYFQQPMFYAIYYNGFKELNDKIDNILQRLSVRFLSNIFNSVNAFHNNYNIELCFILQAEPTNSLIEELEEILDNNYTTRVG